MTLITSLANFFNSWVVLLIKSHYRAWLCMIPGPALVDQSWLLRFRTLSSFASFVAILKVDSILLAYIFGSPADKLIIQFKWMCPILDTVWFEKWKLIAKTPPIKCFCTFSLNINGIVNNFSFTVHANYCMKRVR